MDARKRRPVIGPSDTDAGRLETGPARAVIGWLVILAAFAVYVASSWRFDAGRPDLFYLADAFLHGRLWLDRPFGPWDNVAVGDRVYVSFAPLPSIALTRLVALTGPVTADQCPVLTLPLVFASGSLESIGRHVTGAFPNSWILAGRRARWFTLGWPTLSVGLLLVFSTAMFAGRFVP